MVFAAPIPADLPIIGPIVRRVSSFVWGTVSKAVKTGFLWIIEFVVGAFVNAARSLIDQLATFFDRSSTVSLTDGWWTGPAAQNLLLTVGRVSLVLMGLFVVLAVVDGIFHADIGEMIRTVFVQLPLSLFGTATLVAFTTVLLEASDALSAAFLGAPLAGDVFGAAFGNTEAIIKAGLLGPLLVVVFTAGALFVWVELVIRASLVYLLIMLAPVVLAARIWGPARRSWRRLVDLAVALIVAKPVVAIALALGTAAIGADGPGGGGSVGETAGATVSGMLTAAVLMLLAVFAPFVVLRLLPIVEAAVVAEGIRNRPVRAGMQAAQASFYGRTLASGRGSGGGGAMPAGTSMPGGAGTSGGKSMPGGTGSASAGVARGAGAAAGAVSAVGSVAKGVADGAAEQSSPGGGSASGGASSGPASQGSSPSAGPPGPAPGATGTKGSPSSGSGPVAT